MAPVTVSLILLILCCAGALADNNDKPIPPPPEKPGKCPLAPLASCISPIPPGECKWDKDCEGKKKCCRRLCTTECKDPIIEKPGTCPPPPTMCPADGPPGTCTVDNDCSGKLKCCIKYCSPECTKVD